MFVLVSFLFAYFFLPLSLSISISFPPSPSLSPFSFSFSFSLPLAGVLIRGTMWAAEDFSGDELVKALEQLFRGMLDILVIETRKTSIKSTI